MLYTTKIFLFPLATGYYSEMVDEPRSGPGDNEGHALITGLYASICPEGPYEGKLTIFTLCIHSFIVFIHSGYIASR